MLVSTNAASKVTFSSRDAIAFTSGSTPPAATIAGRPASIEKIIFSINNNLELI